MAVVNDRADVFAALADPTRRWIVQQLARSGSTTPTALAAALPISRQAVSRHLRVLTESDLVTVQSAGREQRYGLQPEPLRDAAAWIATIEKEWDARLTALGRLLADEG